MQLHQLKEIICTLFVAQTLCLHSAAFSAQNNEVDTGYKERLWKQLQRNYFPPRDAARCTKPVLVLEVHKSGLVLDVDQTTKSDCDNVNEACLNALWFAAPYENLPAQLGESADLCIYLNSNPISDHSIRMMQTPGLTSISLLKLTREIPTGLFDQFDNIRSGKIREVDNYFRKHDYPRSIPFIISKNIWMQTMRYEYSRRNTGSPLRVFERIPSDWFVETSHKQEIKDAYSKLNQRFADRSTFDSDKKIYLDLANFMQLLATSSTKPKDNPDPNVAE